MSSLSPGALLVISPAFPPVVESFTNNPTSKNHNPPLPLPHPTPPRPLRCVCSMLESTCVSRGETGASPQRAGQGRASNPTPGLQQKAFVAASLPLLPELLLVKCSFQRQEGAQENAFSPHLLLPSPSLPLACHANHSNFEVCDCGFAAWLPPDDAALLPLLVRLAHFTLLLLSRLKC